MILQHAQISETLTSDQSGYSVRFSEPLSLLEVTCKGFVSLDDLQSRLTHLLEIIQEKQPSYLLADTRNLSLLGDEGSKWIKNNFLPALHAASVVKFARIVEPDVFTQVIIDTMLNTVKCEECFGCAIQSFTDRESALDWFYS